ncbi:MAG: MFS transporter [Theionarchaea archaeon]|nr:MFS transporter [Theionarchaea archaeon]
MEDSKKTFLFLITAGGLISYLAKMLIPPLLIILQTEFSLSNFEAGLLMTGYMVGYAIAQIPSGLLGEKLGRKNIIFAGMIGSYTATLFIAFSTTYLHVLILRIIFGFLAGNYFTPASSMLAQNFTEKERGFAQGFLMLGVPAGTALAPLVAMPLAAHYGWRLSFLVTALAGYVVSVLFWVFIQDREEKTHMRDQFIWSNRIFFLGVATVFSACAVWGFLTFFPKFLTFNGLNDQEVTLLYFLLSAIGVVSVPFVGRVSDRYGRFTVLVLIFSVLSLACLGFMFVPPEISLLVLLIIPTGIVIYGNVPPLMAFAADLSHSKARGFWIGYINTMAFIGAAVGSAVGGKILDLYSFSTLFGFFIGMICIALFLYGSKIRRSGPSQGP